MSNGIVFHTKPPSRSRLVRWRLGEVGQPCRTEVPGYGTSMKAADCLAINPVGWMLAPWIFGDRFSVREVNDALIERAQA